MKRAHRRYQNIAYEVCEREIVWDHPIQHMKKADVIRAMPRDLLKLCWWCRKPTADGKPCHRCYTCKLVDAALERGSGSLLEAPVVRRFKCKHTKQWYSPGDTYRHESAERMEFLASQDPPYIEWPPKQQIEVAGEPKHIGGGWYELPDGQRIRGKETAMKALQSMGEGEGDVS